MRNFILAVAAGLLPAMTGACAEGPIGADKAVVAPKDYVGAPMTGRFGAFLAGQFAQSTDDVGEASKFLGDVLQDQNGFPALQRQAFLLALSAGHLDRARTLATAVPQNSPEYALAHSLQAIDSFREGDYEAAREQAEMASETGMGRFLTPILLTWIEADQGNRDAASAAIARLDKFDGLEVLTGLQRALLLDHFDDTGSAAVLYEDLIEDPLSVRTIEYAGHFFERLDQPAQAADAYASLGAGTVGDILRKRAAERAENGAPAPARLTPAEAMADGFIELSGLLRSQHAGDLSLILARLSNIAAPSFDNARFVLAEMMLSQGRAKEAIDAFRDIPPDSPLHWPAQQQVAIALERLERPEDAENLLRGMIERRPDQVDVRIQLADLLRRNEAYERAIPVYRDALGRIDLLRQNHWRIFYSLGIAHEQSDQWPKAEDALLKALDLKPDQPFVLNYLGYSWADQGKNIETALEMIRKAVKQRPKDGFITDSLGWAYYRLERYGDAVDALERAVTLEPDDPVINDHLGDAYWQVGRRMEARFQWQRALSNAEDAEEIETLQKKLERGLTEEQAARIDPE